MRIKLNSTNCPSVAAIATTFLLIALCGCSQPITTPVQRSTNGARADGKEVVNRGDKEVIPPGCVTNGNPGPRPSYRVNEKGGSPGLVIKMTARSTSLSTDKEVTRQKPNPSRRWRIRDKYRQSERRNIPNLAISIISPHYEGNSETQLVITIVKADGEPVEKLEPETKQIPGETPIKLDIPLRFPYNEDKQHPAMIMVEAQ